MAAEALSSLSRQCDPYCTVCTEVFHCRCVSAIPTINIINNCGAKCLCVSFTLCSHRPLQVARRDFLGHCVTVKEIRSQHAAGSEHDHKQEILGFVRWICSTAPCWHRAPRLDLSHLETPRILIDTVFRLGEHHGGKNKVMALACLALGRARCHCQCHDRCEAGVKNKMFAHTPHRSPQSGHREQSARTICVAPQIF